jgi:hypothetical protein
LYQLQSGSYRVRYAGCDVLGPVSKPLRADRSLRPGRQAPGDAGAVVRVVPRLGALTEQARRMVLRQRARCLARASASALPRIRPPARHRQRNRLAAAARSEFGAAFRTDPPGLARMVASALRPSRPGLSASASRTADRASLDLRLRPTHLVAKSGIDLRGTTPSPAPPQREELARRSPVNAAVRNTVAFCSESAARTNAQTSSGEKT